MGEMREDPRPGELYRHFKRRLYQVLCTARNSETGERVVVYQALYGDYGVWVRPLGMFLSEVDHEKYPDAKQRWRFERAARETETVGPESGSSAGGGAPAAVPDSPEAGVTGQEKTAQEPSAAAPDGPSGVLLAFLDTEDLKLKRGVLLSNAERLTQRDLDSIFTVLGINPPGGSLSEQLDVILDWLSLHEKYESDRPRGRNGFHV